MTTSLNLNEHATIYLLIYLTYTSPTSSVTNVNADLTVLVFDFKVHMHFSVIINSMLTWSKIKVSN